MVRFSQENKLFLPGYRPDWLYSGNRSVSPSLAGWHRGYEADSGTHLSVGDTTSSPQPVQ